MAISNQGRTARVDVERVYRGGPVSARVEVKGTRAEAKGIQSVIDRSYSVGTEYVFAPLYGTNPRFEETACSATVARSAATDGVAPVGGGAAPVPGGVATSVHHAPVALFAGLGAVFVLLLLLVVGQRRLRRRLAATE